MSTANSDGKEERWSILEIMGHRMLAGRISEAQLAGRLMVQIEVPTEDAAVPWIVQRYGAEAIFCETPCSEQVARATAKNIRYQLPETALALLPEPPPEVIDARSTVAPKDPDDYAALVPIDGHLLPIRNAEDRDDDSDADLDADEDPCF